MFKALVVLVLAVPAICVSYYFAVSLPQHNKAMFEFEKQKYTDAKEREATTEAEAKVANETRASNLSWCLAQVDLDFQKDVQNNGTRSKNGSYNVPTEVANGLMRKKENAISECHRQFGK